ncbi:hypothetical protein NEHOM01_0117 [Nematocida homosporus]|uniref:uncharacterized protein n=1 Tax=Nematocida homosporus TaxID=1912981 RepID=UPI002220789A|nr:uncharacterized protein NEHOM01_0117 [Nematocida homosporus]KAI5184372.1 hypothetical protein NEHOM01_0117 [Nematocida homosporus]
MMGMKEVFKQERGKRYVGALLGLGSLGVAWLLGWGFLVLSGTFGAYLGTQVKGKYLWLGEGWRRVLVAIEGLSSVLVLLFYFVILNTILFLRVGERLNQEYVVMEWLDIGFLYGYMGVYTLFVVMLVVQTFAQRRGSNHETASCFIRENQLATIDVL